MKKLKQTVIFFSMMAFTVLSFGQVAVVEYMKVQPGNISKYLTVEKEWMKIHEARLKAGNIISWTLYENMYAGADEAFQYAVVTLYKDFAASAADGFTEASKAAYPKYSDKDWDSFFEKTEKSRVLSTTEVFHRVMGINQKPGDNTQFLDIAAMRIKPGGENTYETLEKDIYQKLHAARIKDGNMNAWSIWAKWPGDQTNYQYVAVNSYSSMAQMAAGNYGESLKKTFPTMKMADLTAKTNAARTLTEGWLWKKLESVAAN